MLVNKPPDPDVGVVAYVRDGRGAVTTKTTAIGKYFCSLEFEHGIFYLMSSCNAFGKYNM